MTENPEKKEDKTEETESKTEDKEETINTDEKYVWVDKNGKKPVSYLLPIYLGIGVVFLIIWILIIVFAVMPAWDEYEDSKKPGLEINMEPTGSSDNEDEDTDTPYTENENSPETDTSGNQSRPN